MARIWGIGAVAILCLDGCAQQEETKTADVKVQMTQRVQPAAQIYWNAVQYISDEKGEHEIVPQNDGEWNRTAEAARTLQRLGEELKRPEYAANRGTDWQDFAQGLVDVAGRAEAAAQAHRPDQVLEVGGTLYNVCSACHEVYMPIPGGLAPTDQPEKN